MPLGRLAPTPIPIPVAAILAVGLGSATVGCRSLPASARLGSASGSTTSELKTRVIPERTALAKPEEVAAPGAVRLAFDRLDQESPLPPALDRADATPPATDPPRSPAPTDVPEPTPLLDEAISRASARNQVIIDEVTREPDPPGIALPPADPSTQPGPSPPPQVAATEAKAVEPVVTPVSTPAPIPSPAVAAPIPPKPEDVWREGVQELRVIAQVHLKGTGAGPRPGAPNWAVRDRLLGWLAEPDIDPDARNGDDVARGRAVLKGLAALIDPAAPAEARGAEIREAVDVLEASAPLAIAELKVCRRVLGFGEFEPIEPPVGAAGQPIIAYAEVTGIAYEPIGTAYRSRLAATIDLIPDGSETPAWSRTLPVGEDTCRRRRRDYFVPYKLDLPDSIPAGNYRLRLTQTDRITDHVAVRDLMITITR